MGRHSFYPSTFLDRNHSVQVGRVSLELFQVAIRFVAGKGCGQQKRRMAQQIIAHVRLINHLVLRAVENSSRTNAR